MSNLPLIYMYTMSSLDWELVSSTLPHKIYLVKRCYNVAAMFVSNEYTVIIEQSTRNLKTFCNVVGTLDITHYGAVTP